MATHDEALGEAGERLANARRVLVLSGAGMSAESGIPTFRDAQTGLWQKYDPETLASERGFRRDPLLVWRWYEHRRAGVRAAAPNAGHLALVDLEALVPRLVVVTQNVDGLHARAGSRDVVALHGDIMLTLCSDEKRALDDASLDRATEPPRCRCGAFARPGVVWFGEALPRDAIERAFAEAESADVCLVVGTSGVVQPAASLPLVARRSGAWVVEINPEPSALTPEIDVFLQGKAGAVLPALVARARTSKLA